MVGYLMSVSKKLKGDQGIDCGGSDGGGTGTRTGGDYM